MPLKDLLTWTRSRESKAPSGLKERELTAFENWCDNNGVVMPDLLRPEAQLIREWNGPLSMMEGIDRTFDGVVFIGYHARAGTPNAVLKHTMSLSVYDLILNGVRLPEAGWNAALAGHFGVPVVFLSGDAAIR
jgi:D-amino peptidase